MRMSGAVLCITIIPHGGRLQAGHRVVRSECHQMHADGMNAWPWERAADEPATRETAQSGDHAVLGVLPNDEHVVQSRTRRCPGCDPDTVVTASAVRSSRLSFTLLDQLSVITREGTHTSRADGRYQSIIRVGISSPQRSAAVPCERRAARRSSWRLCTPPM